MPMYSLLRHIPRRELLFQHAPALGSSLIVAEIFYKFGSFSLEVLAFLGTWFILDAVVQTARRLLETTEVPA